MPTNAGSGGRRYGEAGPLRWLGERRSIAALWPCAITAALLFAACGSSASSVYKGHPGEPNFVASTSPTSTAPAGSCRSSVPGVYPTAGALVAGFVPPGFEEAPSGQSTSSVPSVTYTSTTTSDDPPRIQLGWSNSPQPLSWQAGGRQTAYSVTVEGHAALVEDGPPDPQFTGVYWKPDARDLISVVGYKLSATSVLEVADQVSFTPPGVVNLPLVATLSVDRNQAILDATHHPSPGTAAAGAPQAKLSSWLEVAALLPSGHEASLAAAASPALQSEPWRPIWVVVVPSAGRPGPSDEVWTVEATGRPGVFLVGEMPPAPGWFDALTDRSRSGCPGGQTTRLPFGVLTRDEETFTLRQSTPAQRGATTVTQLKLTTISALNRADPGLFGGCAQQNCSANQLLWLPIVIVTARPGRTLSCLPGAVSVPPGYRSRQVREYTTITEPGNYEVDCGPPPADIERLLDLAPAA
jgi:hypothetical protein